MPTRSPRRNARSRGRAGRTFYGTSGGGGGGSSPTGPAGVSSPELWLRGKDNLGANGSSITTWADQSGYGRNGIAVSTAPTVVTGATPNGGTAVLFSNNGYFSVDGLINSGDVATIIYSTQLASEPAKGAFDSSTTVKWTTNSVTTGYIGLRLKAAKIVTEYTITPTSAGPTQNPKDWTFQGSADGSAWTTLDTRATIAFSGSTPQTFSYSNTTAYLYYRLNVTANNGNSTFLSVTELAMTGVSTAAYTGSAEIWCVVRTASVSTINGLWSMNLGTSANAHTLFTHSTGAAYETFGVAAANTSTFANSGTTVLNTWRLYRATNDGTNLRVYVDNVLLNTLTTTSQGGVQWPKSARIGATLYNTSTTANFNGRIAEVFVRSAISDSTETAALIAYFNTEHGLTVT